ncbi:hypothetical protein VPH35_001776 [Triticum aestivum]
MLSSPRHCRRRGHRSPWRLGGHPEAPATSTTPPAIPGRSRGPLLTLPRLIPSAGVRLGLAFDPPPPAPPDVSEHATSSGVSSCISSPSSFIRTRNVGLGPSSPIVVGISRRRTRCSGPSPAFPTLPSNSR